MGYERLVKSTVARTLIWSPTEENAIDQVAAIGMASKKDQMGSMILRMEALNAHAARQVIYLTTRHLCKRYKIDRNYAKRIAYAVLHEYLRPLCVYCGGTGETHEPSAKVTECAYCQGSGVHRYSNSERGYLLGSRTYNERYYEDALSYVRETARSLVARSAKRLADEPTVAELQEQTRP